MYDYVFQGKPGIKSLLVDTMNDAEIRVPKTSIDRADKVSMIQQKGLRNLEIV